MHPSPEELEIGKQACEKVRFYEISQAASRRDPWVYFILAALFLLSLMIELNQSRPKDFMMFLAIPFVYVGLTLRNRASLEGYVRDLLLLQLLAEKYGEELPWVVEKRQLAQARELEAAIWQDRPTATQV